MPAPSNLDRLNALLEFIWEHNSFYSNKWLQSNLRPSSLASLDDLSSFPLTTRAELLTDQTNHPPLGRNLAAAESSILRLFHSSGSSGHPIYWGDTRENFRWLARSSHSLVTIAEVSHHDRVLLFLPFNGAAGSWLILEGVKELGCPYAASNPLDPGDAVALIQRFHPTILIGRPKALLELAEAAKDEWIVPIELGVRKLICPGRSCDPQTAEILLLHWGAPVLARYGMTEAGSLAAQCPHSSQQMHFLDDEFICETINPRGEQTDGPGELVLTTLGRLHSPIIRYRTGDQVKLQRDFQCRCGRVGTVIQGDVKRLKSKRIPFFRTSSDAEYCDSPTG